VYFLYLVFHKGDCIPVLPQNLSVCLLKYIIQCYVLYFSVGNVTRGGEKAGINKEKEHFAVMVNLFPQELRDIYVSTVLEQVSV
jgi:hypothetical protein